jgi:hypothetical protein
LRSLRELLSQRGEPSDQRSLPGAARVDVLHADARIDFSAWIGADAVLACQAADACRLARLSADESAALLQALPGGGR